MRTIPRPHLTTVLIGSCTLACSTLPGFAQDVPVFDRTAAIDLDTGFVTNNLGAYGVIASEIVHVPDTAWLRLVFEDATLGESNGAETKLRITSLLDGAAQTMNAAHLQQWRNTSAYFNGPAVRIEIIANVGAQPSRVSASTVLIGPDFPAIPLSLCGEDDRVLSDDPRVGRAAPSLCTAWLIDDLNHCFLTAGHCIGSGFQVIEFNVPLSDQEGELVHPGPEDQYAVDEDSMQTNFGGGAGNDWAYFGCFPNTETDLTPAEAQGDWFALADEPPAVRGQDIRVTGYGSVSSPVAPEWWGAQKTHAGPYANFVGSLIQYLTDTTGGNSGSPVIDEETGMAIGIHTHAGCESGGNSGTGSNHPGLRDALANPLGVCAPPLAFNILGGVPELIPPSGATLSITIMGQNGGELEPGTAMMHLTSGGIESIIPLTMVVDALHEVEFPALPCGDFISFYLSAETTDGVMVPFPLLAPDEQLGTQVGLGFDTVFEDDFEADLGWTVVDSFDLTDGAWDRGVPVGGGDRGDPPVDADGSGACSLTDNEDGNSDVDGGSTTLISPTLDATQGDAHISYWRWYSNTVGDNPFADTFEVEISNDDGESWVTLEIVGPDGPEVDGGWFFRNFRIADFLVPTATLRIRFTASDLEGGSVVEAGVDGVRITQSETGIICVSCPADLNGSGAVGFDDLLVLLASWAACERGSACAADLDRDGAVGFGDLLTLLAAWGACE